MSPREPNWFRVVATLHGSVIPAIGWRVLICALFSTVVALLHARGWEVLSLPILGNVVPSVVLGLLLVFRTNTAYERYWEGRKLWGSLVNTIRNLSRQIWVVVTAETRQDRRGKINALKLLLAFAIATKLHLQKDPDQQQLIALLTPEQFEELPQINHPPLKIAFWLEDYLQQQYQGGKIHILQLTYLDQLVDELVISLGGCERIIKTPIPLAYAIHLKQLLLLYCLLLPFQLVAATHLWTGLIVGLISFTLFGVEEIGIEIENPFGSDLNDLPLDSIIATMQRNLEDLIKTTPGESFSGEAASPAGEELPN
jgi:ion channel-forming bestrophin family protein